MEPALAEQHLGAWQGITHEALTERLSHPPHPFWPHGADERPPGGESISDVIARVGPVLERLDGGGNLDPSVDFRSLYATVLERWWGMDSQPVLAGRFAPLDLIKA